VEGARIVSGINKLLTASPFLLFWTFEAREKSSLKAHTRAHYITDNILNTVWVEVPSPPPQI